MGLGGFEVGLRGGSFWVGVVFGINFDELGG